MLGWGRGRIKLPLTRSPSARWGLGNAPLHPSIHPSLPPSMPAADGIPSLPSSRRLRGATRGPSLQTRARVGRAAGEEQPAPPPAAAPPRPASSRHCLTPRPGIQRPCPPLHLLTAAPALPRAAAGPSPLLPSPTLYRSPRGLALRRAPAAQASLRRLGARTGRGPSA